MTNFTRVTDNVDDVLASQYNALIDGLQQLPGPGNFMVNGKIVVTVASNNLTVALKTLAGTDPSATDPVSARFGNTIRIITAALSVTKNAGTSWCNAGSAELATKEIDYFVYLGYNATDGIVIGFSRIPYATIYSDFSVTTTNEKYAGISTITNAAASDEYVNIGRFAATLSAGAGYNWSVPTFNASNLVQQPIYRTRFLTWAPVHTRTVAYTNAPSVVEALYKIAERTTFLRETHLQNATPGGSGNAQFTIPFTSPNAYNMASANRTAATLIDASIGWTSTTACTFSECTASNYYSINGEYQI